MSVAVLLLGRLFVLGLAPCMRWENRSRSGAGNVVRLGCHRCSARTVVIACLIAVSGKQRFSVTSRRRRPFLLYCGAEASPPAGQPSLTSMRSSRIWGRVFLSELRPASVARCDLSCVSSERRVGCVAIWRGVWWLLETERRSNHRVHCHGWRCAESSGRFRKPNRLANVTSPCC